jgi:hypothetical protein
MAPAPTGGAEPSHESTSRRSLGAATLSRGRSLSRPALRYVAIPVCRSVASTRRPRFPFPSERLSSLTSSGTFLGAV